MNEIQSAVAAGLRKLVAASNILWPHTGRAKDRQLSERNLSMYVGHALGRKGYTVITEWPVGTRHRK